MGSWELIIFQKEILKRSAVSFELLPQQALPGAGVALQVNVEFCGRSLQLRVSVAGLVVGPKE